MTREDGSTLGDALPAEIIRVQKVLGHYEEIGPAGAFGAMFIKIDLDNAIRAMSSGEVAEMIVAYRKLKEIQS